LALTGPHFGANFAGTDDATAADAAGTDQSTTIPSLAHRVRFVAQDGGTRLTAITPSGAISTNQDN